jgi:hypothetical protein
MKANRDKVLELGQTSLYTYFMTHFVIDYSFIGVLVCHELWRTYK